MSSTLCPLSLFGVVAAAVSVAGMTGLRSFDHISTIFAFYQRSSKLNGDDMVRIILLLLRGITARRLIDTFELPLLAAIITRREYVHNQGGPTSRLVAYSEYSPALVSPRALLFLASLAAS
jgi:hypothetical protein